MTGNNFSRASGLRGSARRLCASPSIRLLGALLFLPHLFALSASAGSIGWTEAGPNEWSDVGGGVDTPVAALLADGTNLYVGGWFPKAGNVAVNGLARLDTLTETWSAVGSGTVGVSGGGGDVQVIFRDGDRLYIGGNFTTAGGTPANSIAYYDLSGHSWGTLDAGMEHARVHAFAKIGSALYVGGTFTNAGSVLAMGLAQWNGSTWSDLDMSMDNSVFTLRSYDGLLYAGGAFTNAGGRQVRNIAAWNPSSQKWTNLLAGINDGYVYDIQKLGSEIYVAGLFSQANNKQVNYVASWNPVSRTWSNLLTGVSSAAYALGTDGTNLFVGGSFALANSNLLASGTAIWNPATKTWTHMGKGIAGGSRSGVAAMAYVGRYLYVGGDFTRAGDVDVRNIAKWGPSLIVHSGVEPGSASWVGGEEITITGSALGNGSDITSVTLAGVPASIVRQSATQVVVIAGAATQRGVGDVTVVSSSQGTSSRVNAFEYMGPALVVDSAFDVGDPENGVYAVNPGQVMTNTMRTFVTRGLEQGVLTGWTLVGNEPPSGTGGVAVITVTNDALLTWEWDLNTISIDQDTGPFAGGNTITLSGGIFGHITNATVGGVAAQIVSSTESSVTLVVPAVGAEGPADIALQTSDKGEIVMGGVYTVGRAGRIGFVTPGSGAWTNLGLGVDGAVGVILPVGSNVYVGGNFSFAGNGYAANIAKWSEGSQSWTNLGEGLNGVPAAMAVDGDNLYVGGYFSVAGGRAAWAVAIWDIANERWEPFGFGPDSGVDSLLLFDGDVYVSGRAEDSLTGSADQGVFAKWDPQSETWPSVGVRLWGSAQYINTLVADGTNLYAGGSFTRAGLAGPIASGIAHWNASTGEWEALGAGVRPWDVQAMQPLGAALYVGGGFATAGVSVARGIAKWLPASQTWMDVAGGVDGISPSVNALTTDGEVLYAGGAFTAAGATSANYVAAFDPVNGRWFNLGKGMGGLYPTVYALAHNGKYLYAGGSFVKAGDTLATGVAKWIPAEQESGGVVPASGPWQGGYGVTISGSNLGSGTDITNVMLGGVRATIVSQSATQVVVTARRATVSGPVEVRVYSRSQGVTARAGGFEYEGALLTVQSPYDAGNPSVGPHHVPLGATVTNVMPALVALGNTQAWVVGWTLTGNAPSSGTGNVAVLTITNDAQLTWNWATRQVVVEPQAGPFVGGNWITLTNGIFGAITNVTVGGVSATIVASGTNWVRIIAPFLHEAGTMSVLIQTADRGDIVLNDVYTVNPAGRILRIQDGTDAWQDVGGSATDTNFWPEGTAVASDGTNLYAAGSFSNMGGVAATRIAMYEPESGTWTNLGSGIPKGNVYAMTYMKGYLYLGGDFTNAGGLSVFGLAKWDIKKKKWSGMYGVNSTVRALVTDGTNLYVGGSFTRAGDEMAIAVAVYHPESDSWSALDNGLNGPVYALQLDGTYLYAGGAFDRAGTVAAKNVARWHLAQKVWGNMGPGLHGAAGESPRVNALASDGHDLYAAGNFSWSAVTNVRYIARWDSQNERWVGVGGGMANDPFGIVYALTYVNGALYVGGDFGGPAGLSSPYVAQWNPTSDSWSSVGGTSPLQREIRSLAYLDKYLYAAGDVLGVVGADPRVFKAIAKWGPKENTSSGVEPNVGPWLGGTIVTIFGEYLGNGSDITNVVLAGYPATIQSQSATQVVVMTSAGGSPHAGDVEVYSTSFGKTVRTNAFAYIGGVLTVESLFDNGNPPVGSYTNLPGTRLTNTMATFVTVGVTQGVLTGWTMTGNDPVSGVGNTVVVTLTNDAVLTWQWSVNVVRVEPPTGPAVGGNQLLLTNGIFGNITNVTVGGVSATRLGSGTNWVRIVIPSVGVTGPVAVVVQTADRGAIVMDGVYTVNPRGWIDTDPNVWTNLANGLSSSVSGLASDGTNVYVVGAFNRLGNSSTQVNYVAVWNDAARTWSGLGSGLDSRVDAVAWTPGYLYVAGVFSTAGGTSAAHVARWKFATQEWQPMGTGLPDGFTKYALATDGTNLYAGGAFSAAGGVAARGVAMWDPAKNSWTNLGIGFQQNAQDRSSSLLFSNGFLYVGGPFTNAGGVAARSIARWNPSTKTWTNLGVGVGGSVEAIAHGDGAIYVGGAFTNLGAGGISVSRVAKWDIASQTWSALSNGATNGVNGNVSSLVYDSGKLYVGGTFTKAGGVPATNIAMWSEVTQSWTNLAGGLRASPVSALLMTGGDLHAGGNFAYADGLNVNYIAKWTQPQVATAGMKPQAGSEQGGYLVIITGQNFGNGSDVTNVSLVGAAATIVSQSATQIVVLAASHAPGKGDVVIQSVSFGETVGHNRFTYNNDWLLHILSAHGDGIPAPGVYTVSRDSVITNAMNAVDTRGTTQFVLTGWAMAGNAPTAGTNAVFAMTTTNNATLTWNWTTNYWLEPLVNGHGTVAPQAGWVKAGSNVSVNATADQYYHFTNWVGDVNSFDNPVVVLMDGGKALTANIVEDVTTNTATPHWWLAQYGITNNLDAAAEEDPDGDRIRTADEYIMNTDPFNPDAYLRVLALMGAGPTNSRLDVLSWPAAPNRVYDVESADTAIAPWGPVPGLTGLVSETGTITVTNDIGASTRRAYRIRVRLP